MMKTKTTANLKTMTPEGKRRTRVYIAGPISKGSLIDNIRQADDAFIRLLAAGYAPMNPVLSVYLGNTIQVDTELRTGLEATETIAIACSVPDGTDYESFLACDFAWIEVSDAILRLPGESAGADREVAFALKMTVPVFDSLDALLTELSPQKDK